MKTQHVLVASLATAVLLSGCGTNGNSVIPGTTQAPLSANKLQLAVGTVFNANDGSTGLNVVMTFRQPNGLSAVLADNPSITGPFTVPPNFAGPYTGANVDAGTHTISSSPQVAQNVTPVNSTLGTFTGAFSYGLAPLNSDQLNNQPYYPGSPNASPGNGFAGSAYNPNGNLPWWFLPIGATAGAQNIFLLGPPAEPFFKDGTFPGLFAGYSPGFTAFAIPPVTGNYSASVNVVAANAASQSFPASATMNSVAPLPAPAVSGVVQDGAGGLSGTVTIPADPRTQETIVFIWDVTAKLFYSVGPIKATGAQTFTLPSKLGPCNGVGCQNGSGATASITAGDRYVVAPVTFDYPAFEAGPPGNLSQTPTLTVAPANQADLAIGVYTLQTY